MRQPAMLRPAQLIDMLAGHVYMLAAAETSTAREAGSVDHLVSALGIGCSALLPIGSRLL